MTIVDAHRNPSSTTQQGCLLTFNGVDGYDVYNTSLPFTWQGNTYLFGRVERRERWAQSNTRLFLQTDNSSYTLQAESISYPLEDPFWVRIGDEFVLGGTCVTKVQGVVVNYHVRFYRGKSPFDLEYFTSGPEKMKDIRLLQLPNEQIAVMSRHRGSAITSAHGTLAEMGYTQIDGLDALCPEIIQQAPLIPSVFTPQQWGGANQLILLDDHKIGVIGHHAWQKEEPVEGERPLSIYVATSFILNTQTKRVEDLKLIGKRSMFPFFPPKKPHLNDCIFTSGIVIQDGQTLLYSGLGDTTQGYLPIQNPFQTEG